MTVVLIEDNGDHADLIAECLRDHGVTDLVHVSDGPGAVDLLLGQGAWAGRPRVVPSLILLDLRLPKLDGLAVLARVRDDPAVGRVPVVVLTTSAAPRDVERAYTAGANAYLVKPLDFDALDAMLADTMRFWLGWNVCSAGVE